MTESNQDVPTTRDDQYVAGDTAVLNVTITLDDSNDTNLTNVDIAFALAAYNGGEPLVEKDRDNGIDVTDAENGEIAVQVAPSDTEGLGGRGGKDYYYEIEVTDSTGDVATVTTGTWTIHPNTA